MKNKLISDSKKYYLNNTMLLLPLSIILFVSNVFPQIEMGSYDQIAKYFNEAKTISEKDNGKLWGVKLYGPMLFVNPENRMVFANQPDKEGYLKREGNVYRGDLPNEENIANTAFVWLRDKWTMVIWPLPKDEFNRANLMMHELFHRIQDSLGFPARNPSNNHLDEKNGRILLLLELQALKQALSKTGAQQVVDIKNALLFRNYRRSIYPDADDSQSVLEMNEGLAEYTGVKLSGRDEYAIKSFLKQKIDEAENLHTFVRSFAYITGPIYGILLDQTNFDWRRSLIKNDDLADLLAEICKIEIPQDLESIVKSLHIVYNGDEISKRENERERERLEIMETYCKKFIEDPILIIPLKKMNIQFDPRNMQPLDSLGTVYQNIRISDSWGILTVNNVALLSSDWTNIKISAQSLKSDDNKNRVEGEGWQLELNEGWKLVASKRKGDWKLMEMKK